ncbi:MAG TPA: FG-GAP-like repeat-containing protein, partial [Candidatus Eisenbacteria bacterium]|nr:FG-GAP-like repeat-containing protein [Candidatus Eisenbacteria bacterium]
MSIKNSLPSPFFSHYSVGDLRKDWKVCCLSRAKCWRMGTEVCVLLGILLLGTVVGRAAVAPLISAIPDQVTFEDVPILRVPFTIWDADTPLEQLRLSTHTAYGSSSFVSGGIDIGGAGSNRWFSIYPRADWFGPIYAAITVSDDAGLSATALFHVQVNPVNDPPRFSLIPDQTALRGQGVFSVPFVVSDPDTPINQVRLTAWSSRQSVVSNAYLRIATGSLQTNRSLVITLPTNGVAGSTAITIQADDLQSSNIVSFIVNVQPPDFVRTNSAGPATAENFQPGCGDFNGDGLLDLLVSPTQIYTNAGNGTLSPGITLPSGIVASSAAAADFDGDGNLDLLVYGSSLVRLFRNSGGSTPTFSEVPIGPRLSLPFGSQCRWADLDGDGAPDIVYASSGRVSWLRNNGAGEFIYMDTGVFISSPFGLLAVGDFDNDGDPDVLVSTTSAPRLFLNDGTGRLVDSQVALPPRETRAAGWTDIDGDGLLDLWLVQPTVESFFNSLIVLRQTGGRFVEVFRLTDPVFSQTPFVPVWADFDNDGNVDFVGRYFPFPTPNSSTTTPNSSTNYPSLYRNEGGGHFASTSLAVATTTGQLLTAVGDFDNDGSPDLLYRAGTTLLPMRNQSYRFNALPNAPTGLHALVADDSVVLFWNEAS